jgi:hypothetical protein
MAHGRPCGVERQRGQEHHGGQDGKEDEKQLARHRSALGYQWLGIGRWAELAVLAIDVLTDLD